jgi:hypothetical protein
MYHWRIIVEGTSADKESVLVLQKNLEGELWHPDAKVNAPVFSEIPKEMNGP